MACAYHIEGARTDAVLFGGNIQRQSNAEKHVQRGLTMFSFGKALTNKIIESNLKCYIHNLPIH